MSALRSDDLQNSGSESLASQIDKPPGGSILWSFSKELRVDE
jgi:hypothetical protein